MKRPNIACYAACILAAAALWQFGEALYIAAKAELAQHLIARAWARAESGATAPKPWPWADTTPVARLTVHGRRLYVLADASGRTLAFGPGHLSGTALPGHGGNTVISGHRDTHFALLEHVREGDEIVLDLPDGSAYRYAVIGSAVVHERDMGIISQRDEEVVTLLTCFPFRALTPRGPLRYAVIATRV